MRLPRLTPFEWMLGAAAVAMLILIALLLAPTAQAQNGQVTGNFPNFGLPHADDQITVYPAASTPARRIALGDLSAALLSGVPSPEVIFSKGTSFGGSADFTFTATGDTSTSSLTVPHGHGSSDINNAIGGTMCVGTPANDGMPGIQIGNAAGSPLVGSGWEGAASSMDMMIGGETTSWWLNSAYTQVRCGAAALINVARYDLGYHNLGLNDPESNGVVGAFRFQNIENSTGNLASADKAVAGRFQTGAALDGNADSALTVQLTANIAPGAVTLTNLVIPAAVGNNPCSLVTAADGETGQIAVNGHFFRSDYFAGGGDAGPIFAPKTVITAITCGGTGTGSITINNPTVNALALTAQTIGIGISDFHAFISGEYNGAVVNIMGWGYYNTASGPAAWLFNGVPLYAAGAAEIDTRGVVVFGGQPPELPAYTVVALAGLTVNAGAMAFATDARNTGEGAGAGTGSLVTFNGTLWRIPGVATAVTH